MSIQPIGRLGVFCRPLQHETVKNADFSKFDTNNVNFVSYPKEYYISFCGGKSLNLGETYAQIQKLGEFPSDIEGKINDTLNSGNLENKTLKDIHQEKYSELHCCDSMEELRGFFPEFEGVKSDEEFTYSDNPNFSSAENSRMNKSLQKIIKDVKSGQNTEFSSDEDLSLQLVKMYWGDGKSQSDIGKKLGVADIYVSQLFKGFNIPAKNQLYGYYLKMSDVDNNKEITGKISKASSNNAREVARKKLESAVDAKFENDGRTDENISNLYGQLQTYYDNHRNMPYSYTAEDYRYFAAHPTQAVVFTQVVLNAFGNDKAKKMYDDLKDYLGKKELTIEDISHIARVGSEGNQKMEGFWDNKHKRIFSECMKDAMKRQKHLDSIGQIYEPLKKVQFLTDGLLEEMKKSFEREGKHDFSLEQAKYMCYHDASLGYSATPEQEKALEWITNYFENNPEAREKYSATLQCFHFMTAEELVKKGEPEIAADILATLSQYGDEGIAQSYKSILNKYALNDVVFPVVNSVMPKISQLVYKKSDKEYLDYEHKSTLLVQKLALAGFFTMKSHPDGLVRLNVVPDTVLPRANKRLNLYTIEHPDVATGFSKEDIEYFKQHKDEEKLLIQTLENIWNSPQGQMLKQHFIEYEHLDEGLQDGDIEFLYKAKVEDDDTILEDFFKLYPQDGVLVKNFLQQATNQKYKEQ